MLNSVGISGLLLDHTIARAEQALVEAVDVGLPPDDIRRFLSALAGLHEQRRIGLEEMMRLPFRSARVND